ncbi:hypothetical protein O4D10_18495 [Xanthomonas citri pv. citri]|uniref:hypothetical protein n=1 Tax=Xanthomonas citri TaxID=346 RepID=UPI0036D8D737
MNNLPEARTTGDRSLRIVPIPGTTNIVHLEQNAAAASVSFTAPELKELQGALQEIHIEEEGLPPAVLSARGLEAPVKP